jgi:lipopolysaccharide transport system ATP-binding protein
MKPHKDFEIQKKHPDTHSLTNSSTHPPSSDVAIRVDHISKKFCRSLRKSMRYGMHDIGRNLLRMGTKPERLRKDEFWAVDDVSFEVRRGETLGIIGPNGSGKSTILKMLNGIFMPDKRKIEINGRVGALIELGAGFHPLLTGRENIYVNGAYTWREQRIDRMRNMMTLWTLRILAIFWLAIKA